ncbi:MAG: hypothetical protein HC814_03190 [Rhodobacteraceae bacterium]|nr:hypothetical protein [Paracoccaceae bacterium]
MFTSTALKTTCLSLLLFAGILSPVAPVAAAQGVKLTKQQGKVLVEIDGHLFTEYHFEGQRRPYFYPIIGPTGASMTRNWPMKDGVPGEEKDHVHHRGLWYGHRHVNDTGFWEESAKPGVMLGKIVHDKFLEVKGGPDVGVIRTSNKWIKDDGTHVMTDETTMRFHGRGDVRMLDFDITFIADKGDVVFGADKDAAMAIRVPETSRLDRPKEKGQKSAPKGEGHIVTSEGKRDAEAWGTRARWCDYHGPADGKVVGVAIFDHPSNPRHPTWWHVRGYGLFAANPFAQAQFENLPDKKAGEFTLPAGQRTTFRYRFYWHLGDEKAGQVESRYQAYVKETSSK